MKTLLIILLILATSVLADETSGRFGIVLKGGVGTYWGDIDDRQYKPYGDMSFLYWASDNWGVQLNTGIGFFQADDGTYSFKTATYGLAPMVRLKPWSKSPLNFYLTTGFELVRIDPSDIQNKDRALPNNANGIYDNLQWAIPVGLGLSVFVSEYISLDLEGIYHQFGTDYLDDRRIGDRKDSYGSVTLGASIYFNGPPDTDGDGIIDKKDADPYQKEDFDGFQDTDGAPDHDNDMDGVPDLTDEAPLDPEDRDGYKDSDGVPDLDNDLDGIPDTADKAPMDPEDVDGFEDDDGAPDPDNDFDGIADADDECPNEAETVNGYEDEDGCPDTKPEISVEKGKAIILKGVNFSSGSTRLTKESTQILDKVYRTLRDNQEIEVEIRGYTDNVGNYESNVRLSERRADAVKAYLVEQGILSTRILIKGFGPADPVASNTDRTGRAMNRRIEFFRIK